MRGVTSESCQMASGGDDTGDAAAADGRDDRRLMAVTRSRGPRTRQPATPLLTRGRARPPFQGSAIGGPVTVSSTCTEDRRMSEGEDGVVGRAVAYRTGAVPRRQ